MHQVKARVIISDAQYCRNKPKIIPDSGALERFASPSGKLEPGTFLFPFFLINLAAILEVNHCRSKIVVNMGPFVDIYQRGEVF